MSSTWEICQLATKDVWKGYESAKLDQEGDEEPKDSVESDKRPFEVNSWLHNRVEEDVKVVYGGQWIEELDSCVGAEAMNLRDVNDLNCNVVLDLRAINWGF